VIACLVRGAALVIEVAGAGGNVGGCRGASLGCFAGGLLFPDRRVLTHRWPLRNQSAADVVASGRSLAEMFVIIIAHDLVTSRCLLVDGQRAPGGRGPGEAGG